MKGVKRVKVTARAIYKSGRLIFHNSEDIPDDGAEVTVSFDKKAETSNPSLRGSWAKCFPERVDLDRQLRLLRKEWETEG
jgi:hypothetical protein